MTRPPNWFDNKYSGQLEKASVAKALEIVSKDDRLVIAVQKAMDEYDRDSKDPDWGGPSRAQSIRQAIADTLSAED